MLVLWDSFVVYPFRIFVVFLHEISHGIAAVLTGGRIVAIGLSFDEGGVCQTRGGWPFVILNAGYLGSLFWGSTFLVLGERHTRARSVIATIGLFTLAATLVYVRTPFGFGYGLLAAAVFLAVAARLPPAASEVLLATIGATSALYAVWDVASDVPVPPLERERRRRARPSHRHSGSGLGPVLGAAVVRRAGLRDPPARLSQTEPATAARCRSVPGGRP